MRTLPPVKFPPLAVSTIGVGVRAKTSWNALIEDYRSSDRWLNLKPRTWQDYERVLIYHKERIGTRDVKALTRADVIDARKANARRTRFATYIPQMFVIRKRCPGHTSAL